MTIRTNNSFPPSGPTPGPNLSSTPTFNVGLFFGAVTAPAFSAIIGFITLVVINSHITFYYRKTVIVEDLTSSKFDMKETIWIGGISFSNTTETWNCMLEIPNNKYQVKRAKDLGHQFMLLAGKIGDGY